MKGSEQLAAKGEFTTKRLLVSGRYHKYSYVCTHIIDIVVYNLLNFLEEMIWKSLDIVTFHCR